MIKKLQFYIVKHFLQRFLLIVISISLLISVINLFDVLGNIDENKPVGMLNVIALVGLQIPAFLEDISIFLVMLAAMISLSSFSAKSEITVMRASGLSLWQILTPLLISAFILGLVFIFIFNPLMVLSSKRHSALNQTLIEKEWDSILEPKNGIWIKQRNIANEGEEITIRARKINKNEVIFSGVNIWFFDNEGKFYRKIDAKKMFLFDNFWKLQDVIINDDQNINKTLKEYDLATNLKAKFIIQRIINNFENPKLFSIYELPTLMRDLEQSGFSARKFRVYYYSLLTRPFIFMAAVLIASFFAIGNIRSKNNILYIAAGIMFALLMYIGMSIINALGASEIIPPFAATWIIVTVVLSVAILLVFKKEHS